VRDALPFAAADAVRAAGALRGIDGDRQRAQGRDVVPHASPWAATRE
jgi:hypothetical protein